MIETVNDTTIALLREMKKGDELRVKYSSTNLNNVRRDVFSLNRLNKIDKKMAQYSVSSQTKPLGYITIWRVE